jgi:N-acetylglucosaminyldiphosphoundecaprenol N-acetyl-beta-D-mannosaminyltransferase
MGISTERFAVGPVRVSALTFDAALGSVLEARDAGDHLDVHFCTAHTVVEASRNVQLRHALERAEVVAPDGMPLVWVGKLQGRNVERVYGPDFMLAMFDRGRARGYRHYLYGGAPGVAERLAERMSKRFTGLEFVGIQVPPFRALSPAEDAAAVDAINAARPDCVWIGLGSPKQDLWVAEHRARLTAAAVLAVGAAFDFHAGVKRQAPRWMRRSGTEWLFRLLSEPRRLWRRYTVINLQFLALIARQALGRENRDGGSQR